MSALAIPLNTRKERFSLAYINAVVARAGFELVESRVDLQSIDGIIRSFEGRRPQIDFQAKATAVHALKDENLAFDLSRKNYDDLRCESINPRILIVVLVPELESDWMSLTEDQLIMRRCGYWMSLRARPEVDNSTTVRVNLPRTQIFDAEQLCRLMHKAQTGPVL